MESEINSIRQILSEPRRAYNIQKVLPNWHQCCAGMDVVEDTEMAIDAFMAAEDEKDCGRLYLLTYGVLQALYAQQNAVHHMCQALGIQLNFDEYPSLKYIREIRHKSAGHPSKTTEKGRASFHGIIRDSLKFGHFELLSWDERGKVQSEAMSVCDLICEQRSQLDTVLRSVSGKLRNQENEHKMKFKDEKLVDSFGCDIQYHCRKISECISSPTHHPPVKALVNLAMIKKGLENFCSILERRGTKLETYDSLKQEYEDMTYPLTTLQTYFENLQVGKSSMGSRDAHVYWESMQNHLDTLIKIAQSLDKEYQDIGD